MQKPSEGLGEEPLNLASAWLQILDVRGRRLPDARGDLHVLRTDEALVEEARLGGERVDRGIDTDLREVL